MKRLTIVLIATIAALSLVAPAHAVRSGSAHLDGRNQQVGTGNYPFLCDDFGGLLNFTGIDTPACFPTTSIAVEAAQSREFNVAAPADCNLVPFCTSSSNLVGVVQMILHSHFGGPICNSNPYGIDGIVGPNTRDLIVLFNAYYLGVNSPIWDYRAWQFAGTKLGHIFDTALVSYVSHGPIPFDFIHDPTNDTIVRDYIIVIPYDGSHGTNYSSLDPSYGPDC